MRAGLYTAQAGAPSVHAEPYICGGNRCSVAGRPGRFAVYLQAKRWNKVPFHRNWCIFKVCLIGAGSLQNAKAITAAFTQVLTTANPLHPKCLQTDKGKEFFNSNFRALMKRHGIQHFASKSEQKAAVVERFNKTIKTRIWTYLSDRNNVSLVDII